MNNDMRNKLRDVNSEYANYITRAKYYAPFQNMGMEYNPQLIADRVKEAVKASGKSNRKLAELTGLSEGTIRNAMKVPETGRRSPTAHTLFQIAKVTESDIYYLLGQESPKELIEKALSALAENRSQLIEDGVWIANLVAQLQGLPKKELPPPDGEAS